MDGGGGSDGSIIPSASRRGADLGVRRHRHDDRRPRHRGSSGASEPARAQVQGRRVRTRPHQHAGEFPRARAAGRQGHPHGARAFPGHDQRGAGACDRHAARRQGGPRRRQAADAPGRVHRDPHPERGGRGARQHPRRRVPRGRRRQPGQRHHHRLLRLGRLHLPAGDRPDGSPPGRAALHQRAAAAGYRGRGQRLRERADQRPRGHRAGERHERGDAGAGEPSHAGRPVRHDRDRLRVPDRQSDGSAPDLRQRGPGQPGHGRPLQDGPDPGNAHDDQHNSYPEQSSSGRWHEQSPSRWWTEEQRAGQSRLRVRSRRLDAQRRRRRGLEPRLHHATRGPEHGPDPHGHGRAAGAQQPPVPVPAPGRNPGWPRIPGIQRHGWQPLHGPGQLQLHHQRVPDAAGRRHLPGARDQPLRHHHPARAGDPPSVHLRHLD